MNPIDMLLMMYQIVIFVLLYKVAKDKVYKNLFPNRYYKVCFIDLGWTGFKLFSKDGTFNHEGKEYALNRERLKGGTLYYTSKIAEPLNIEFDNNKASVYPDSTEFATITKNKVLKTLMYVQSHDLIMFILILAGAAVALDVFLYMRLNGMEAMVKQIVVSSNEAVKVIK